METPSSDERAVIDGMCNAGDVPDAHIRQTAADSHPSSHPPSPSAVALPDSRASSIISLASSKSPEKAFNPSMRRVSRSASLAPAEPAVDGSSLLETITLNPTTAAASPTFPSGSLPAVASPRAPTRANTTSTTGTAAAPVIPQDRRSLWGHLRSFLGHGNPRRRRVVRTMFGLALYSSQIVVSIVFITLTQTTWKSQEAKTAGRSEWDACDKPLGSMMIVWLVRCILGVILAIWAFRRSVNQEIRTAETRAARRRERRQQRRQERQARLDQLAVSATNAHAPPAPPSVNDPTPGATNTATDGEAQPPRPATPSDVAYDRALSVTSILIVVHFLITNVLIFSSTKTCRLSSPHLWWSTFAMLCLTYIIILEVFVIGFAIFIVMPMIFIGLNILLILTGHRPISARQMIDPDRINPETPKMSQKLVDKIPLVLYIPAPEAKPVLDEPAKEVIPGNDDTPAASGSKSPIPVTYPPSPNDSPLPALPATSTSNQADSSPPSTSAVASSRAPTSSPTSALTTSA